MERAGRAHTRIPSSRGADLRFPDLFGDGRASLTIRRALRRFDVPSGSRRANARWSFGDASGGAELDLLPLWQWGAELHLTLRPPSNVPGRLLWGRRRLQKLADRLIVEIRDVMTSRPAAAGWATRPASSPAARHLAAP